MTSEKNALLTVAEVAETMRVSKMTIYRLCHSGELESLRVGRSFRIPARAVENYLNPGTKPASGDYTVKRRETGVLVHMYDRDEPETFATIHDKEGRVVASVRLNATTMCLPEGGIYGLTATDDQIIRAVLGDEDVFTGAPSFPDHHDKLA